MQQLETNLDATQDIDKLEAYKTSKKELENIEYTETAGQILRSKARWTEEGEKNSAYFLNLEKRNYLNKTITKLESNGKLISNEKEILNIEADFYNDLYSEKLNNNSQNYKNSLNIFLEKNSIFSIKKLSDKEKDFCEQNITEQEILKSLKGLHNGKTPGTDGLPADFYKYFWIDIKTLVTNSILYAIETGELSIEQKRGIITLIPQKN